MLHSSARIFNLSPHYTPVKKAEASFKAFNGAKEVQFFSTMLHKNGFLFYDEKTRLFNFYTKFSYRARTVRYPALVSVISNNFEFDGSKSGLSKRIEFLQFNTLNSFLNDVKKLKAQIEEENDRRKLLETDRKVRFFIIELNNQWKNEINESANKKIISELLSNCVSSRIVLFFVAKNNENISDSFVRIFDWVGFLGGIESEAERIFNHLEKTFYDEDKLLSGTLYDKFQTELIPIHEIWGKRSSFKAANDLIDHQEDLMFKELLGRMP